MWLWLAGCATPEELPLRVHVLASDIEGLDASAVADDAFLQTYFDAFEQTFAPTGMTFVIEDVREQEALDPQLWKKGANGDLPGGAVFARQLDPDEQLAPDGWDLLVVGFTSPMGFGGVYTCSPKRHGIAVVPTLTGPGGEPQVTRKWSHELGHAMGLPHTECTGAFRHNLMMSGKCELADLERTRLNDAQIRKMERRARQGGASTCSPK